MKRLASVFALLGAAGMVFALSTFNKTFNEYYKVKPDSRLGRAACMVCHTSSKGGALNPYGTDVKAAMKAAGLHKVTNEVLKAVEGKDSLHDGTTNGAKIRADKNPGIAG